jgi:LAO/AO transport system kinase
VNAAALAARIRAGDVRAAARLMRAIEDELGSRPEAAAAETILPASGDLSFADQVLRQLYPASGTAFVVGITGPPGAGKSSLVDALITRFRARGDRVGVVAVDPSSPFSGGAVLGDRIRMQRHALDEGVFIRSLATRGQLGGLSRAAADVVTVMAAMGQQIILVETVGVGQDEVDIIQLADVVAVVLVPGLGDDVQAIKAGLLEIADLFVVNKADREGADRVVGDLAAMLALGTRADAGTGGARADGPEILTTVATSGQGLDLLEAALQKHRARIAEPGAADLRRRRQASTRLRLLLLDRLRRQAEAVLARFDPAGTLVADVAARRVDPRAAVDLLFQAGGAGPASS